MKANINYTNNQNAFEYAVYMMVGSYFKKATCKNPLMESKLWLHYAEQSRDRQYTMEDLCIDFVESELIPNVDESVWAQEVMVHFVKDDKGVNKVLFVGPEYVLSVRGKYSKNHPRLTKKLRKVRKESYESSCTAEATKPEAA